MTGSNNPRRGLSYVLRQHLTIALAFFMAGSLLIAGCKKNGNSNGNTSNSGNTSSTNVSGNSNSTTSDILKGQADEQGQAERPDRGNFTVRYSEVQNPKYAEINERFRQQKFLEGIADELNASIAIPENVFITFKECGQPNAFWDPETRSINMCYELMEQMAEDFKEVAKSQEELNEMLGGAMTFAFIHELGHCLIDVLKLPSTGREEDAVDQLSTFVLLALNGDEGEKMAINGALSWGIQYDRLVKSGKTAAELNMLWADEHSMNGQRFYNILCWVLGHNPNKWAPRLVNHPLPEARAVRCPSEYTKLATAWLTLLKPYLKDGGAKASQHTSPMTGDQGMGGAPQAPEPEPGDHSGH